MFQLRYYTMLQSLYKTDSWFQKSPEDFGELQTSRGKSKKLKFDGLLFSKKYIPSGKTLCTEDLSNFSCHFCHFSRQLLCIFKLRNQILSTKVAHQSGNIQTFHCLGYSSPNPHVIFQTKSQFFFKVWIFFQCHER